jgi:energy-coupling factor transporter ATP-binding protein EcfA2
MPSTDFEPVALAVVRIILRVIGLQSMVDSVDDVASIFDAVKGGRGPAPTRKQIQRLVRWAQHSLSATFEAEYRNIAKGDLNAALFAVAELLNSQALNDLALSAVIDSSALEGHLLVSGGRQLREHLYSEDSMSAFDLILRSSCRHLAEITLSSPEFGPLALQRLLSRQDQLETISTQILESLSTLVNSPYTEQDFAEFTSRYLTKIAEQLDFLDIPGIDLERTRQRYNMTMSYVPIAVRGRESQQFECNTLDSLTQMGNFILVVGDPGSGKSTLLKWVAVEAARAFSHAKAPQQGVPFLIKLRSLLPGNLPDLDSIGSPMTEGLVIQQPRQWSSSLIETGRALLLFDGLDEVAEDRRESIVRWINQIHRDHGRRGTKIIVTSRPTAIMEERFQLRAAITVTIRPMPYAKIERFVTLWHQTVDTGPELHASDWKAKTDQLLARMEVDRQLAQLASNPLLCAVICALYHARGEHLPSERSELYEALLAMLLARRDQERRSINNMLSLTDTQRLVEEIALFFLNSERNELPQHDVLEILRTSLRGFRRHELRDMRPGLVLDYLTARTGVIRQLPPDNTIDFWHKSFQEFLAARVLLDQEDELVRHCTESAWREVIIWACSLMRQAPASSLLGRLLDVAEDGDAAGSSDYLTQVILSCAHYTLQLDYQTQERLDRLIDTLVPPVEETQLNSLLRLGTAAVPLLAEALRMPPSAENRDEITERVIEALTTIGGEAANNALASMPVTLKRRWAQLLARGWSSVGSEDYARRVLGSVPYSEASDRPIKIEIESLRELRSIDYISPIYRPIAQIYCDGFDDENLGVGSSRDIARVTLVGEVKWSDAISFLYHYTAVDELIITLITDSTYESATEPIPNVRRLRVQSDSPITLEIGHLAIFPCLEVLEISGSVILTGAHGFAQNQQLRMVTIDEFVEIAEVAWLGDIEDLHLPAWPYPSLKELAGLKNLQLLDLQYSAIETLDGIKHLPQLFDLDVSWNEGLRNVDEALSSKSLSFLKVQGCVEVPTDDLLALLVNVDISVGEDDVGFLNQDSPTPGLIAERWMECDLFAPSEEELTVRGWDDWSFWKEIRGDADEWATPDPEDAYRESLASKGLVLYESLDAWVKLQQQDSAADPDA